MITTQEQLILDEYLRRRVLRQTGKSFLDFAMHIAPFIVFEEFHILIAEKFQLLLEGLITRLMIFAPPRAGKSLFTSELLPQWWIGNFPRDQILHTSYATTLVEGFGRKTRNTIGSSDEFKELFPYCRLSSDSKSATRWNTTAGGVYNAAGVGTGIAGKGWHLGLCLSPDTQIITTRGVLPAMSVRVGDYVLGETGYGEVTRKLFSVGKEGVIVNNRLHCSRDHRVYVVGKGYIPAKEVACGDSMLTPRLTTIVLYNIVSTMLIARGKLWALLNALGNRHITSGP